MPTIANFTPEAIRWKHQGIVGVLNPGDFKEFDTARANHILNKWGARGLVQLQFGDEEHLEEKKEAAMRMYSEFWLRQITTFNQQNEVRRNENRAYVFPPKQIMDKAKEFDVEVIGPWKVTPKTSNKEVEVMKSEVDTLKNAVSSLQDQMSQLIEIVTQQVTPPADTDTTTTTQDKKGKK